MQQKFSSTSQSFNQNWNTFKVGFGDPNGDYWLGNDVIHNLTQNGGCSVLVQLQSVENNKWYEAQYSTFIVDPESAGYKLHVGGYSENTTDALSHHNGMLFTMYDRDQDTMNGSNCASTYLGGNWYIDCSYADVNLGLVTGTDLMAWYYLLPGNFLLSSRLWLTC